MLAGRPRLVPVLGILAVCAGLSGCGDTAIRTGEVEDTIARQFAAQGIRLDDVDCRDGVTAEVGARIACTALNPSRTTLVLEGRVTAIEDGEGSFRVKAVRGVAQGRVIAAQALAVARGQRTGRGARSLTCPARVPIPTTPTVACALTTRTGARRDAEVAVDVRSTLTVRIAGRPQG